MASVAVAPVVKTSIFARIKAKLKLWSEKLAKDEPKVEVVALSTIEVLAPLAETIIDEADPALAPVVEPLVQKVQADLAALTVTIEDAGSQPTVASVVGSIQTNLSAIDAAVGVKSPKATQLTATIASDVQSIAAELFPASSTVQNPIAPATGSSN